MSTVIIPQKRGAFERLAIDEWLVGDIVEVQSRLNSEKKVQNKETKEWTIRPTEEVRFVFRFDGYRFSHFSRWLTRSLAENSNLYTQFLSKLTPNVDLTKPVDIELLVGMKVKAMWDERDTKDGSDKFQYIANIKPLETTERAINVEVADIEQITEEPEPFALPDAPEDLPF
jgi:hypothetical protein